MLWIFKWLFGGTIVNVELRNKSCNSCEKLIRHNGKRYCGACGCPKWTMAELDTKLKLRKLVCPLGRPGFYEPKGTNAKTP